MSPDLPVGAVQAIRAMQADGVPIEEIVRHFMVAACRTTHGRVCLTCKGLGYWEQSNAFVHVPSTIPVHCEACGGTGRERA